jgi:hypothetical protein
VTLPTYPEGDSNVAWLPDPRRTQMLRKPKLRLFRIRNEGDSFFTGVCADSRQGIMGLLCPEVVAVFFDAEGNYLGCEARPWSKEAGDIAGNPPHNIFGVYFQALIAEQMEEWQTELRFRKATIRVKEFWVKGRPVGIEELPSHLRDIETAAWIANEEERQGLRESRDRWLAEGNFVFWWAKDFFMSRKGEVEST